MYHLGLLCVWRWWCSWFQGFIRWWFGMYSIWIFAWLNRFKKTWICIYIFSCCFFCRCATGIWKIFCDEDKACLSCLFDTIVVGDMRLNHHRIFWFLWQFSSHNWHLQIWWYFILSSQNKVRFTCRLSPEFSYLHLYLIYWISLQSGKGAYLFGKRNNP